MSARLDSGSDPLLGHNLDGRYRVEESIGRGGMGEVYRGRHLMMDRAVAIKVLRPDLADDENAVRRFAREAKGTFRFDHANCVRVFDFGFDGEVGVVYLVMEYLDGRTIADDLAMDGPIGVSRAVHISAQICAALDHAHDLGLVHRDLKPDNVMLVARASDPDFAKVLDFGLAKLFEPDSSGTTIFSLSPLTQDGVVFGTPEYMSPEQAMGKPLFPASDLYAVGVILYEMLTGMLPFQGGSFMATLTKQVREIPISPANRRPDLAIPSALDTLVMDCLAKAGGDRPATALVLSKRLAELELGPPPSRLSPQLAASETMDLSVSAVAAVATAPTAAIPALTQPGATAWERRHRRRGLAGAAIAVGLVASIILVVLLVAGGPARGLHDAAIAPPAADAGSTDATGATDAGAADATIAPDSRPANLQRDKRRREIDSQLRNARQAQKRGNTLKQIAAADAVLRLDKHNREAAYLLGDGLVSSGDKARGCGYLAQAKRLGKARRRAQSAGCR